MTVGGRRVLDRSPGRRRTPAPTIRLRLTALYGTVFLITGAALLTIGYLFVRNNLRTHHSLRAELIHLGIHPADGATVSAEQLLERVWDEHTDPFTNVVRMTIMTLRRKLGEPPVVQTVIGVGYRMA